MRLRATVILITTILIGILLGRSRDTEIPDGKRPRIEMAQNDEVKRAALNPSRPSLEAMLAKTGWPLFQSLGIFLPEATTTELEILAHAWGEHMDDLSYPEWTWKLVLARWLELDPAGALALEERLDQPRIRGFCYRTWIHLDYDAALAAALSETEPPYKEILSEVVKRDLALAKSWYEENPRLLHPFMTAWAKSDPDAAIASLDQLEPQTRDLALRYVIKAIASSNKARALQLVDDIGSTNRRYHTTVDVVSEWLLEDVTAAGSFIQELPSGKAKAELFTEWVKLKAQDDPQGTWDWARRLPSGSERHQAIGLAAERLAGSDPDKLLALFDEVGWKYAMKSPEELSNLRHASGGSRRPGGLSRSVDIALQALAKENPRAALAKLAPLPGQDDLLDEVDVGQLGMLEFIGHQWFQQSPVEALEWISRSPDIIHAENLATGMLSRASEENLKATEQFLLSSEPTLATPYLSRALIEHRAKEDPIATLELTNQLDARGVFNVEDSQTLGVHAYSAIARSWLQIDSMAMSEWAGNLESGPHKDAAVNALITHLSNGDAPDYEAAFHWAQQISETSSNRDYQIKRTWSEWHRRDPQAAEEALQNSVSQP